MPLPQPSSLYILAVFTLGEEPDGFETVPRLQFSVLNNFLMEPGMKKWGWLAIGFAIGVLGFCLLFVSQRAIYP